FSRKQIIHPRALDLNETIAEAGRMLRRLIGEDIELELATDEALWNVQFDPHQIEQVLINLVVNARDAMPRGGKLTLETQNVRLERELATVRDKQLTGDFVMFAVTDTGEGIDPQDLDKIFEPFFTTKKVGYGTGLGLPTVYGIVKQNNGFINVYSELGHGTTFKIYIPRETAIIETPESVVEATDLSGSETILVVEDQIAVRQLAERVLRRLGYRVLSAGNGEEALAICRERIEDIDMLVTDVVMPGMSGKTLLDRIHEIKPDLKALYISGYTQNTIVNHGVLDEGTNFLQKPFRPRDLAGRIREILDR
ncbi:MAG: ATP-binding protein, partial [Candidatus Lernaella stagnicola]|nr:ATP-binding protein [Candidatus Lernaella stagnicola]